MSVKTHLLEASRILGGSYSALAARLGVKPPTVSEWGSSTRPIPLERGAQIERETNGVVRVEDLCPQDVGLIAYLGKRKRRRSNRGKDDIR